MNNVTVLELSKDIKNRQSEFLPVYDVACNDNYSMIKKALIANGLEIFVKPEWLKKFAYHALVNSHETIGSRYYSSDLYCYCSVVNLLGTTIKYGGDIPDFALDRAIMAERCGIRAITIHSTQVLPLQRQQTDPLMIGWFSGIVKFTALKDNRCWDINDNMYNNHCGEGVILGVWDYDKEFNL